MKAFQIKSCAPSSNSRGEATRKKILSAAREAFSRRPYNAASIRMIAAQGKFEHGIIRYYFPNKASLFEAVVIDICKRLYECNARWLDEASSSAPGRALELYLDRLFEFNRSEPENLKIIAVNLAQNDDPEAIPGYDHIVEMLGETRQSLEKVLPENIPRDRIDRFQDSFNALVLHYLGACSCEARILGLDPQSSQYYEWVKKTILMVFSPLLISMFESP